MEMHLDIAVTFHLCIATKLSMNVLISIEVDHGVAPHITMTLMESGAIAQKKREAPQ